MVGSRGRLILRCGFCVEELGLRDHKVGFSNSPKVHLVVQVGKFDPQDIYVGDQVQLLSGQSATVLEVSIRALFSSL